MTGHLTIIFLDIDRDSQNTLHSNFLFFISSTLIQLLGVKWKQKGDRWEIHNMGNIIRGREGVFAHTQKFGVALISVKV